MMMHRLACDDYDLSIVVELGYISKQNLCPKYDQNCFSNGQ